jgi:broad specificity phosphatase PhoE
MRLLLIRHGESHHSNDKVVAEVLGCRGLTELGVSQAQAMGVWLRGQNIKPAALLSSPSPRARQTADAIAVAMRLSDVEVNEGLLEVRVGEADGMSRELYHAAQGTYDMIAEPDRPFARGGESWNQFLPRVRDTLERLATRFEGKTVIGVTHAGFIVASVLTLFDIPRPGTRARLEPRHASLIEWERTRQGWTLGSFNQRAGNLPQG